jgi:aspartate racemase
VRRVGLIGGLAWPSTEVYHRLVNEDVARRLGGNHSARLLLWAEDFAPVAEMQRDGDWDGAGEVMAEGARALAAGGAELLAICANTMHLVADAVRAAVDLPLVHIVETVAGAADRANLRRLGLLGTAYTMTSRLYPDALEPRGVDLLVPLEADRDLLQDVIYTELTRGVITERGRAVVGQAADRLVQDGADGVVLGCTELSLVLADGDLPVPVLDSAALHCRAIVDAALG